MKTKKCLFCGKEFETDNEQKKYCTHGCARKDYYKRTYQYAPTGKKIIKCKYCHKEFEVNMSGRVSQYCSRSCKNKFKHAKKNPTGLGKCLECGKEIILHFNKNGETKNRFCSQYCGNKYHKKINKDRIYLQRNTPERRYNVYMHGALTRNIEFNLTLEEFKTFWNQPCYYCGDNIEGIGIDRINSLEGYNIKNCVSCCSFCNTMKLDHSPSDFFSQISKIYNKHTALVKSQDSSDKTFDKN